MRCTKGQRDIFAVCENKYIFFLQGRLLFFFFVGYSFIKRVSERGSRMCGKVLTVLEVNGRWLRIKISIYQNQNLTLRVINS